MGGADRCLCWDYQNSSCTALEQHRLTSEQQVICSKQHQSLGHCLLHHNYINIIDYIIPATVKSILIATNTGV
jgi:hypothetical protein